MEIDLNKMLKRGGVGILSVRMPDGSYRKLGTVRGPRHSRGYRKHLRRTKQGKRQ